MSVIKFRCEICSALLRVDSEKAGKKAKCKCGAVLTIPYEDDVSEEASTAVRPGGSARRKSSPALDDEPAYGGQTDVDDFSLDDEDDEPRPRRRARDDFDDEDDDDDRPRRRRRAAAYDDDDEDFGDRPRRRRRREDDDDDYDDDDEVPRRRRPRKRGSKVDWQKVNIGFLIAFIATCVIGVCGVLEALTALLTTIGSNLSGRSAINLFEASLIILKISRCLILAGFVGAIVGFVIFLIVADNKKNALGFAIALLAVMSVYMIMYIVFQTVPIFRGRFAVISGFFSVGVRSVAGAVIVWILLQLLFAATWTMAALYIAAIGRMTKYRSLSDRFALLVGFVGGAAGLNVLMSILAIILRSATTGASSASTTNAIRNIFMIGNLVAAALMVATMALFIFAFKDGREATDRG